MFESDVFERTGVETNQISDGTYNLIIGLVLCWGFLVNWLLVQNISAESIRQVEPMVFFIGYFASCFLGIYLFNKSQDPSISFLGYNLVVVPFGLVVNVVVSRYDPELVLQAIQVTAAVTVCMMIMGTLFPAFFQKIHTTLFISLLAVIIIEWFQILVLGIHSDWLDWAVVIIFCGYIGFDWGKANRIPKTVDNAIDSAAAIYMDIINLFLRILRILGRKK
jgi:FtsH-binding integral membrane protein